MKTKYSFIHLFSGSLRGQRSSAARWISTSIVLLSLAPAAWAQLSPNVTPFASGLKYPRGIKFGPDGQLYVAEAGAGGTSSTKGICPQVEFVPGPYHGGFTARISKISPDGLTVTTVADGLPSAVEALGDVIGIADVAFIGDTLYALSSGGAAPMDLTERAQKSCESMPMARPLASSTCPNSNNRIRPYRPIRGRVLSRMEVGTA